jgi:hypothetical protein
MSSRFFLLIGTLTSTANGFSPSSPFRPQSQLGYVDEHASPTIGTSSASMESRVEAAMATADLVQMKKLLTEMYHWQDACTEEGNQLVEECDLVVKSEREVLMKNLEDKIASVFMSSAMTVMAISGGTIPTTLEDQVQACLSGTNSFSTQEMKSMLNRLEELQSDCTEEGNQTNQECDIVVKAQRDVWIKKLERKIADPMAQMRSKLELKTCSISELTDMLHFLEGQTDSCTEEGNQTKDECDVIVKAEREELMELLEAQIVFQQSKASKSTELCLQYKLCDPAKLTKTYAELEELNNLCTEEGNQTRSFCSLEAKDQRDEMMAKLEYELNLAERVIEEQRQGNVPAFQI